ncbi:MAG: tyrosine-type recombinase/integrase [Sideroxydans sp.]
MSETKERTLNSIYADHITNFIAMKRRMRFQFINQAVILFGFDRYLSEVDFQGPLTQELVLNFTSSTSRTSQPSKGWCMRRYRLVQQFSVYLSVTFPDALPLPAMTKAMDKTLRSIYADHITNFIDMRKLEGYRVVGQAAILFCFDRYLREMDYRGPLTRELAQNFADSALMSLNRRAQRYRIVQQFSVYLSITVPDTSPLPQKKMLMKKRMDRTLGSVFAGHIASYIEMKKRIGYRFEDHAIILLQFDCYLYEMDYQGLLTQELALNFATSKPRMSKNECARKYQVIRQFSDYLVVFVPDTPPLRPDVLIRTKGHAPAHIYTDEEMACLMNGARRASRVNPLRNVTLHTMIGLIASTGLRISEVVTLNRDDVNLETGVLTVRRSKFQKDRLVPVHPTTLNVLRDYVPLRDARFLRPATAAFFIQMWGGRFSKSTLQLAFHHLACSVGVRVDVGFGPSVHDLRHTFAVRRLVACYREGKDVQAMLPLLATYMGHVHYSETAYYLTATAELLGLAAERYDAFLKKEVGR